MASSSQFFTFHEWKSRARWKITDNFEPTIIRAANRRFSQLLLVSGAHARGSRSFVLWARVKPQQWKLHLMQSQTFDNLRITRIALVIKSVPSLIQIDVKSWKNICFTSLSADKLNKKTENFAMKCTGTLNSPDRTNRLWIDLLLTHGGQLIYERNKFIWMGQQ